MKMLKNTKSLNVKEVKKHSWISPLIKIQIQLFPDPYFILPPSFMVICDVVFGKSYLLNR